ncbi:CDGSH iron-sulfur domain-containing protein [Neobacillus niacini]|uniref:CDGSH iron-sulfur domain-containing protein n=1 Tax=Neobacillus niacini TaxID=86668 RepID=UPI0005F0B0F1|nr:CDGSH iron-sulfur domain-containing protein [Neobacillus niacini]
MDNKIIISDNGPLEVNGDFHLYDSEGNEYTKKGKVYLCRCGLSNKKPFCDGSHKRGGFVSSPRVSG